MNEKLGDIANRLRMYSSQDDHMSWRSIAEREAAVEIETLTAENERLRSALEEAIIWSEFPDLERKWRKLLDEL